MVKCNFGMTFYETIIRNGGKELKGYQSLSKEGQLEIISKFWANIVKFILLNKIVDGVWEQPSRKEYDELQRIFCNIPNARILRSRKQDDNAYLAFSVSYNSSLCTLEILPYIMAKDKETEERYIDKVSKDLIKVEQFLSRKLTKELVIKFCFETLYGEGVCSVIGDEAVMMYKIMQRANKHYPDFVKLDYNQKIEVLRKGYRRGMQEIPKFRDNYTFARATFEILERSGLNNFVYKYDWNINKYKTYERCGRHPSNLPGTICPRFITYKVTAKDGTEIKTSFGSFDLWELLAKADTLPATA